RGAIGEALLQWGGLRDFSERWHEQQIVAGAIQPLEQSLGRRHEQGASRTLDEPLAGESTQHERHRLAGGSYQLAEEPISRAAQLDAAIFREEALVRGEPAKRGDQSLLDGECGELPQLLEECGPF